MFGRLLRSGIEEHFGIKVKKINAERASAKADTIYAEFEDGSSAVFLLKRLPSGKAGTVFKILAEFEDRVSGNEDIGANKPLFVLNDNIAFSFIPNACHPNKKVFNYRLYPFMLIRRGSYGLKLMRKCAAWIKAFQELSSAASSSLESFDIFDGSLIENDLKNLSVLGLRDRETARLRGILCEDAEKVKRLALGPALSHGDIHMENFLVDGSGKLFVIDYENLSMRTAYDDISLFGAYLEMIPARILIMNRGYIRRMKNIFYDKCARNAERAFDRDILKRFELRYLSHLVGNDLMFCRNKSLFIRKYYVPKVLQILRKGMKNHE